MSKYRLSNTAKEDLIRIHHYGVKQFGMKQADKYFESFFDHFELIAKKPNLFESVDFMDTDVVFVASTAYSSKQMEISLR